MTRRDEIYQILLDFARSHSGSMPSQYGLWQEVMRVTRRKMAYGVFRRHMNTLEKEGRIQRADGVIVIPGAGWHPPKRRKRK